MTDFFFYEFAMTNDKILKANASIVVGAPSVDILMERVIVTKKRVLKCSIPPEVHDAAMSIEASRAKRKVFNHPRQQLIAHSFGAVTPLPRRHTGNYMVP